MLFAAATFLGAFLLFLVQPMIGRLLLPGFGGSAAVWTLCLLFFQVGLLAGYGYTHLLVLRSQTRRGVHIHLALLALAALLLPISAPRLNLEPTVAVLGALTLGVGAPYLLLSATAPLVQAWAARADRGRTPYRLYAWSNAGSLLALIAYPTVVEPLLGVRAQTWLWSGLYLAFIGLLAFGGRRAAQAPPLPAPAPSPEAPGHTSRSDWALWIGLPALSTTLLVATSDRLTEDFSATPFLWVLPLGLFLLTYILAFGNPRWTRRAVWLPLAAIALTLEWWAHHAGHRASILTQIAIHNGALFVLCLVLHGELVRRAPPPARLTSFYLGTALGGALGGLAVGILAPNFLPLRVELQIGLVGTAGVIVLLLWRERRHVALRGEPAGVWLVPALLVLAFGGALANDVIDDQADVRATERGFFGVIRVRESLDPERGPSRKLLHGRIMHGREYLDARRGQPVSYYGPHSGIALALEWTAQQMPKRRMGVLGLGIGTLAAFARCDEQMIFWEIDPLVEQLAREWFSFLEPGCADLPVRIADGRLGVAASTEPFDLLILDAFSGDAIPTHLLTRDAVAMYLQHLTPAGVLIANVSNRHLDLRPVLRDHAAHFGLHIAEITSKADRRAGLARARWIVLARSPALRDWIEAKGELDRVPDPNDRRTWTDDHAPLLPLLRALR